MSKKEIIFYSFAAAVVVGLLLFLCSRFLLFVLVLLAFLSGSLFK